MKIIVFGLAIVSLVGFSSAMTPVEFATSVGANEKMTNDLRIACQTTVDPVHCFGVGLSISNAESNLCNASSIGHGCFGRVTSNDKSAVGFVRSYSRYYYIRDKYNEGGMFYGYGPQSQAPTRYCLSEYQPDGSLVEGYCPNGRGHFNRIYKEYQRLVMNDDSNIKPISISKKRDEVEIDKHKPGCRFVGYANDGDYIQLDSLLGRLLEIFRPKNKEKQKVFICSQ